MFEWLKRWWQRANTYPYPDVTDDPNTTLSLGPNGAYKTTTVEGEFDDNGLFIPARPTPVGVKSTKAKMKLDVVDEKIEITRRNSGLAITVPPAEKFAVEIKDTTGEVRLRIHYDGSVTFGSGCTPDDASRMFWKAMQQLAPLSTNRCKHCRERRGEHAPDGKCCFETTTWEEDVVSFD